MWRVGYVLVSLAAFASALEDDPYHPVMPERSLNPALLARGEDVASYWVENAQAPLRGLKSEGKKARNVIMFLGDGMSVPTLAAARTLLGQRSKRTGEESKLSFEEFPTTGLSKTYCVNAQIADSACSATAYLCGVKANQGTLGVTAAVPRRNCSASLDPAHRLDSIAAWALADGRDAGIVTSARVTHASPAGAYAHSAERGWESDADLGEDSPLCSDIAMQLVHENPGKQFKVILGGGRREFLSKDFVDNEGKKGTRTDGRNLINEWQEDKRVRNESYAYVWNRDQLVEANATLPNYLLGLFESSHLQYNLLRNITSEPTLAELTEVAIRILSKNEKGFFLFVEGGRIDHAHHSNYVELALDETIELSAAVSRASELLSEEDSLLVVTADHAHVMAFNGYTARGNDVLGASRGMDLTGAPYMTLSYTNGPGYRPAVDGIRPDVTAEENYHRDPKWRSHVDVPLSSETHGGDDVAVFARGPQHHIFTGLYEQNHIPHRMAYAACIGPGLHACNGAFRVANLPQLPSSVYLVASSGAPARDEFVKMMRRRVLLSLNLLIVLASVQYSIGDEYHNGLRELLRAERFKRNEEESSSGYWIRQAQESVGRRAGIAGGRAGGAVTGGAARNVVLFLGDGMSVPTLTAARTLLGQRESHTGEETHLFFEDFPTSGLAKTYCVDAQVADSACTATSYLCGVKTNRGTIGVTAAVERGDCDASTDRSSHVESIATWALADGRDAGIVTSARVTHASPAGAYAHVAQRDWESDANVRADRHDPDSCPDIAYQLVHQHPGVDFKVILGGGRREFLPSNTFDEEGTQGHRLDGRNLIEEWQIDKIARNVSYRYVWNREQLLNTNDDLPEYLLGLFEGSHLRYNMEADSRTEPSLADLTETAIRSLRRNDRGFFLFVEGGRIDHAHHENRATLALDETIELSKAVERAAAMLSEEDSLLVVTADHAHVMALNGYTHRGGDILGVSDSLGDDGIPYMTLSYTNGPGYRDPVDDKRADVTKDEDFGSPQWVSPASVPLSSETHGGDDVAVFARGAPEPNVHRPLRAEQHSSPHGLRGLHRTWFTCIGALVPGRAGCPLGALGRIPRSGSRLEELVPTS
ncbi:unnamed protein product [Leptosia nina]|uniref:Alkaline phosphatase n=1 Tax=Leptosia nina TaxID=320188 RepID=A0AAV1K4D2_9NEOP